jgi:uncharacterized protein YndB with AHSA1/START domain
MGTNTIRLHRVLRCPPERIYRAFIERNAFERWLPPFGFIGRVHDMNPVVGGAWRMSFTNFGTGHSHAFGGKYLELMPSQRIAYDAAFDDANLPGTMKTTVTLTPVSCGTDMAVVQEGVPDVIPTEMCYLGWQESLIALAQLVEPDIPG